MVLVPDAFMLMGTLYNTSLQHLIPHHVHHAAEGEASETGVFYGGLACVRM